MGLFSKQKKTPEQLDKTRLPRHIAVIMDGNGRWAKKRGLPRRAGHAAGAETFRRVATYCKELGIEYLTVYAFSTENWKRPADEVRAIMELLEQYLTEAIGKMERDRVKMKFFGDTAVLSAKLQKLIRETERISERFDGVQVNVCVNYGARDEVLRAAQACKNAEKLTEAEFEKHLFSAGIPDPDLVIRPGGELRLSNFLLWQAAYAELYFTDTLWPDFDDRALDRAILDYQSRARRFGGTQ
ncbi:MAG: di-trans,poly-cis-decaprenylcistransferase [Oscillospiraceae bacterium]|jgi:undecaprenyl diphosphate synthase|nr:di-trans,poly-cis-decaprenylcistransferase [Oscillospiraceae bacterium]